jgi:AcrR family transcriptional regulator
MALVEPAGPSVRRGRPRIVQDEDVFEAMTRVVLRVGLPHLSINEVAADIGVTPAALRQRFGSKAELLHAFHAWSTERVRHMMDSAEHADRTPLDALKTVVQWSVPTIESPAQLLNAVSMLTDSAADDEARRQIGDRLGLAAERTTELVRRAIAARQIDYPDAAELSARMQEALIGACIMWALRHEVGESLADRLSTATDHVLTPYLICERTTRSPS